MARNELLDIVNDEDTIIGQETRENIHKKGLLHREIHVWFITPRGKIIFQHRAKDKDTYPDLLDATVGGHVEPGMTYDETAIKETEEETGLKLNFNDLILLKKMKIKFYDKLSDTTNNSFQIQYGYLYKGKIADLHIEQGNSQGFEEWSVEQMVNLSDEDKKKFIPFKFSEEFLDVFKKLKMLI